MQRTSLVKVVTAFVAGLVIALGSALVSMRGHANRPTEQITASTAAQIPVPPSSWTEPQAQPKEQPAAASDPPDQDGDNKTEKRTQVRHQAKAPAAPKPKVNKRPEPLPPVQVVQNTMPSYPVISQADPPAPVQAAAQDQTAAPGQTDQDESGTAAEASPPAPQPHTVELAAGTNLSIRLGETLSTDHSYTGDTFRGTLEASIVRDGFIIAEKGSKVLGRIVSAEQPGRMRGVAGLNLTLTEINTTDGQRIRVETNSFEKRGPLTTGSDAAKIAGGTALGALFGALGGGGKGAAIGAGAGGAAGTGVVLATRGKPAVLPSETRLTFQLTSPVTITEKVGN